MCALLGKHEIDELPAEPVGAATARHAFERRIERGENAFVVDGMIVSCTDGSPPSVVAAVSGADFQTSPWLRSICGSCRAINYA